jgi:hypothetical protein
VELVLGIAGAVVAVAAVLAPRRIPDRRSRLVVELLGLIGWGAVLHFLIAPLVPSDVLAYVMLGGITLAIFAAAAIGARKARRGDPVDRRQP